MSLILTVPERLAQMCYDASEETKSTHFTNVDQLDSIERPAWIIEIGAAEYPDFAVGDEEPKETYTAVLVGKDIGLGATNEYEQQAWRIVDATVKYFLARRQLQMSNQRGAFPAKRGSLDGVKTIRLSRTAITQSSRGAEENFWGCQITFEITEGYAYDEVLEVDGDTE